MSYEFYEKPNSYKFVMMKDSAAPLSQKRTVLIQERIRRLKNCQKERTHLTWLAGMIYLTSLISRGYTPVWQEAMGLKRAPTDSLQVSFFRGEHQGGWLTPFLLDDLCCDK